MRVVYDTNQLARIFARRGEMIKFVQLLRSEEITPIVSEHILAELERVLNTKFGLTKQKSKTHTRLLIRIAKTVAPGTVEKVARDPDDDYILATAVAGRADQIVTLDKDLLVLKEYKGVKIVKP